MVDPLWVYLHGSVMDNWRILMVDDEPEIRELVTEYLEGMGHHVDAFASGKQAMERLGIALRPYDLALVDWTMPGISGRDVVQDIQRRSPVTAIVIATGRHDITPPPGMNITNLMLLRKPFSLRELARALEGAMSRAERS